jgi:SNF2 family DNA or RNA helicase
MPVDLKRDELFTSQDLKNNNTYILGKHELEKPRELSEEEKQRIHHRHLTGWTFRNPINSTKKFDATQLIQNPAYRAGFDTLTKSISGAINGAQLGIGSSLLFPKRPTVGKLLIGGGIGAAAGTLPSILSITHNYKKQKLYNQITEEYIKNHYEGQITSMPDILKEMLNKPKSKSALKVQKKTIKTSAEFKVVKDKPFKKPNVFNVELPREAFGPSGVLNTVFGGLGLTANLYEGISNFHRGHEELNDVKDRFEQKSKQKREADTFITRLKTPIYKKHETEQNKMDAFDQMFKKTSIDHSPLLPHQQRAIDKLKQPDQPGLILMHGLGSGKSRTSIEAYKQLGLPAEVIAPAALKENYQKEIHKWIGKTPSDIDITSQQEVARNNLPEHEMDGKLMIIDEAHRLRNEDTKLYKNLKEQNPVKRLLLTGTPIYNDPSDIAKLINIASGKEILPERKPEFDQEYVGQKTVFPSVFHRMLGVSPGQELHVKNKEYLRKVFHKMIDYHAGNAEGFPDMKDETVKVPMGKEQQYVYKAVMKDLPWYLRLKVSAGLPPNKKDLDKLIPFLSGARMISNSNQGFTKDPTKVESPKIDKAFDYLKSKLTEDPDYKGVVYSNYLNNGINEYKRKLDDAKIPYGEFSGEVNDKVRNNLVKDYNANKIRALLLSSAGGEGLDLKGTRLVQLMEPHFNLEKIKQLIGRSARYKSHEGLPKDKQNVLVQHYLSTLNPGMIDKLRRKTPTSTDEYLQNMSDEKDKLNQEFIKLIKD